MDQQLSNPPPAKKYGLVQALIVAIALILLCTLGFHLLAYLLGISLAMSAAAWGVVISTIVFFSIAVLLFFIVPAVFTAVLIACASVWVLLSIILFPLLFPIIMPIFIILIFIGKICRSSQQG